MQLFYSPTSPFARKTLIVAKWHALAIETHFYNPFTDSDQQTYSPLDKVPALLTDEEQWIVDSPIIAEYLDSLGKKTSLFTDTSKDRFANLRLQAFADGIIDSAVSLVMESRREDNQQSPYWQDRWLKSIMETLAFLNKEMDNELSLLQSERLNMAIVTLICALDYLTFRLPNINWQQYTKLTKLYQHWASLEVFTATKPS